MALHDRLKATTVYVTHDQLEAMSMADTIAIMNQGVIEQLGAPQEVYERPASVFVADFIGSPSMNFLPFEAALTPRAHTTVQIGDGAASTCPSVARRTCRATRAALYGVRPEHVKLERRVRRCVPRCWAPSTWARASIVTLARRRRVHDAARPKVGTDARRRSVVTRWGWQFDAAAGVACSTQASGRALKHGTPRGRPRPHVRRSRRPSLELAHG